MAEALLGLAPSGLVDATNTKLPISHVDQLQTQLRHILETKSSETRSEHMSVLFDIRPAVQLTITTAAADNDNDGPAQIDPALEGSATPVAQTTRLVRVNDAVMNQPQDNPTTQRSVAKHIIGLLSAVDASSWVVRDISRGAQGWTFTYICKDSMAAWNRQHAKNSAKPLIGEYSLKELDETTANRPAFDCRGSISITFSKSSRSINITYDHTPFHKTVGQLVEYFRPPPRPVPAPPVESTETPKKTPRKRKSVAAGAADGQETNAGDQPKKTPRKRKSEAAGTTDGAQPSKRRKKKSDANNTAPEAVAGGDGHVATNGDGTAQSRADHAVQSGVHAGTLLNVPPAEAARRRETAIRLLSDSGVDPETLSADQFAIFANQSPDLQKESLAMLVQYGAERLRIVHPKDAAGATGASTSDASSASSPQENAIVPANAELATPASGKKRARKSKGGTEDTPASQKDGKPKLSRGSCSLCRGTKTKCDKAKPSCGPCREKGLDCQYPLEVSRGPRPSIGASKVVSAAEVDDEEQEEPEVAEPAPEPAAESEPEPDDIETIDYTSNMPVSNMLTPAAADTSSHHDYFANTGFPPAPVNTEVVHGVAPSSLNYPEPPAATYSQVQPESPKATHKKPSRSSGRHALPGSTASNLSAAQTSSARQQPAAVAENQATTYASMNGMQTLTNAALQQQSASPTVQPAETVTPAQQSPFQSTAQVARSKSRAGQRAQTRTPLADKRTSTPSHRTVQQNAPSAPPPAVDTPAYGSSDMGGSTSTYGTYGNRYSNAANEHESSRLNYEPYAAQNAAATSNTYQPSSSHSTRASTGSRSTQPAQAGTSSFVSSSSAHGRNNPAHGTSSTSSYADPMAISNRQTASLQSFNMRSAASTQPRSSSGYTQSDPKSYDFSSNQAPSTRQQQQQQNSQQQQQNSQQGWYGGFTAANGTSSYATRSSTGYAGSSADSGAYQQQQQPQQQHGQMNISGHGYSGETDYFDLMRSMHPR